MKGGPVRGIATLIALAVPAALLGAAAATHAAGQEQHTTAGKAYKNIRVLKNLPADQLIPLMHKFNASLGVRCDFCHVVGPNHTGFELDTKPAKGMARKMIVMSESINLHQPILDHHATCYMCHHGQPEPETQAPQGPGRG